MRIDHYTVQYSEMRFYSAQPLVGIAWNACRNNLKVLECYPDLINRETIEFEVTTVSIQSFPTARRKVVVEAIELKNKILIPKYYLW